MKIEKPLGYLAGVKGVGRHAPKTHSSIARPSTPHQRLAQSLLPACPSYLAGGRGMLPQLHLGVVVSGRILIKDPKPTTKEVNSRLPRKSRLPRRCHVLEEAG